MLFAHTPKRTYLDWAAAAPVSKKAQAAFMAASTEYGNPSSPHAEGRAASALLEDARMRIARLVEAKAGAVILTGNATEANVLLLEGHIEALHTAGRAYTNMHVLYHPGSHASLTETCHALASRGVEVEALACTRGVVDGERLRAQIRPETVLIAIDAVNGETGMVHKTRDIRRVLTTVSSQAVLHVDASQLPLTGSLLLSSLGADTLTLDAQKVGGVRGIGALIAPRRIPLHARTHGGGQERGLRAGTQAHALASAFAVALEEAAMGRATFVERASRIRTVLVEKLSVIPDVVVHGGDTCAPRILSLSLPGRDTDYLAALLDAAGIAVSTRSACETDSVGSRAVLAETGDEAQAAATLRISWGPTTTDQELMRAIDALISSVTFLDTTGIL